MERNRRAHDRFQLKPMYTTATVRRAHGMTIRDLEGHAYDISESGVRLELDEPLESGERVALQIQLPGEPVEIFTSAKVVWVNRCDDDPGPRRQALEFVAFNDREDRDRLRRFLGSGLCHRVA